MYCVIMAGGSGTRFWPQSREKKSKQFLKILGKRSLIQSTMMRFQGLVPWEDIFVVAKKSQEQELLRHTMKMSISNIIYEPVGKNTAPCIGLAALHIADRDPDAVLIVSPADHLIKQKTKFQKIMKTAVHLAETQNGFVTIGIKPNRPATGYGYIQIKDQISYEKGISAYTIQTFAEKPNLATAQRFLESGDFLWNSGLFVFKVSTLFKALSKYMPELYEGLMEIKKHIGAPSYTEVVDRIYKGIPAVSIDYGVMEKADNVFLVKGCFSWNDLGSWEQVYKLSSKDEYGNSIQGNALLLDTKNSYICDPQGLVAVIGLDDIVVVREGEVTLVCKRDRAEDVKLIVEKLRRKKLDQYL